MTIYISMGTCISKATFDELKYPSYCPNTPPSHDDHLKCLEIWTYAVRTRPAPAEKSFTSINRAFTSCLEAQHATEQLPANFLIHLVSTLLNGRHTQRAAAFRRYNISSETWSAVGTALLVAVKGAYAPRVWTDDIKCAWLRCYGALLREVFRRSKKNAPVTPPILTKAYSTHFSRPQ
jgi:hypothetical protein